MYTESGSITSVSRYFLYLVLAVLIPSQFLQLTAWFLRLITAAALAIARYQPDYDVLHLWQDPRSERARIFCGGMLFSEIVVSAPGKAEQICYSHLCYAVDPHLVPPDSRSATCSSNQTHRLQGPSPCLIGDPFPAFLARRNPGGGGTRSPRHPHTFEQPGDRCASRLQPHLRDAILLLHRRRSTVAHA